GQRRALAAVAARLSGGTTPAKLPKLDDQAITDLVLSFEVASERMTAVRYAAEYTFHFRPEATRRILGSAAPAAAPGTAAKPVVVVPLYQSAGQPRLWEDPNPWRQAWEQLPPGTGPVRVVVPLGDAGDIAAVDADKALAGDAAALAALARRNGGEESIVMLATPRGPPDQPSGVDVTVRRYRTDAPVESHVEKLTADPGESGNALLRRAVTAIVADIGTGWKNAAAAPDDQEGSLTAILPITGLDDWVRARERLARVPEIHKIDLLSLSREEAKIEIGYGGNIDQLKASLAQISLDLVHGDPLWRLARTGPAPQP
ncbi:MAG TPA: DUF2066 domain-containing protein, partial [Stellaceae bacterium]|nr:DUF2066 domain-containing protein [Stellaceae bacterium]